MFIESVCYYNFKCFEYDNVIYSEQWRYGNNF